MADKPANVASVAPIKRIQRSGIFGREDFITTTVTLTDGSTIGVSQYAAESPDFGVDSLIGSNGFPHWVHGEGERTTSVRCLNADTARYLNALVAEQMGDVWANHPAQFDSTAIQE